MNGMIRCVFQICRASGILGADDPFGDVRNMLTFLFHFNGSLMMFKVQFLICIGPGTSK